jgi:hypothetical protein
MLNKFFTQLKTDGITLLRLIQSECLHNIKAVILLLMLLHILTIEIFYGNADIQDVLCYSYTQISVVAYIGIQPIIWI